MYDMKKMFVICWLLLGGVFAGYAQVTVERCYEMARANYPLIAQYGLIGKTEQYNLSNVGKGYLPQVALSAKATYQSDITQLPIDLGQMGIQGVTIPSLNRDQYGMTLDVNQTLWDGGAMKAQKEAIRASAEVDRMGVDVNLYALNERINQLFFGILLAEAQLRQNGLLQEELTRQLEQVQSYIVNGVANQSDADAVCVDLLKAQQDRIRMASTKKAYIEMLALLTGEALSADTEFIRPEPVRPAVREINRPELAAFDAQLRALEVRQREITSSLMPKLGLFVTGGYGNPGLNMFKNGFLAYYIGGVKLSWNFGGLYTKKNKRNMILTDMNSVQVQRDAFLVNTDINVAQIGNAIDSYTEQLTYDDRMITLRRSVKQASEVKLANGTLSGTDLVRDIHAEQMAIQDKILHEMELLLAVYNLKFATNN